MQKIKLSSFIVLLNLSKFFEKMLSKHDPLLTDNISVNFEICMLPIQMKGSSAIQEKKKIHFSTRVNACGIALTSTAVLKQALWWLIDSGSSRLPLSLTGEMSASALDGGWSQSLYSSRLPERGNDEIAAVLMDVRAILTLCKEQALCLH